MNINDVEKIIKKELEPMFDDSFEFSSSEIFDNSRPLKTKFDVTNNVKNKIKEFHGPDALIILLNAFRDTIIEEILADYNHNHKNAKRLTYGTPFLYSKGGKAYANYKFEEK